jgi:signal transduction histidine kinase
MLQALRRRLTGIYVLVLSAILLGYSLGTYALVGEVLAWAAEEGNHHLAMPLVARLREGGLAPARARHELAQLALTADERLQVLDAEGRVIASAGGLLAPPAALTTGVTTLDGHERFRVLLVPVTRGDTRVGYVRAAHSLAANAQAMALLGWVLAGLLPLALLVAWAAGNWLAGQAARPVEDAIARERRFTHDAAHELRTPLSVLSAQTELALKDPALGQAAHARLAGLLAQVRKLSRLVSDLLTLSREDAGPRVSAACDLEEIVEEELAQLAPLAADRGVTLAYAGGGVPESRGEAARVAQSVRNLLDNAVRYSPPGAAVAVKLGVFGDRVTLAVTNPGPGVPGEEQALVFERFHRAPAGRAANPDGTGLGLAISRAIAEAQGGSLTLESRPEGPTTFTLSLPRA